MTVSGSLMGERYLSKTRKSQKLYQDGKTALPSGVSYFIRYMKPYPFYTARAKGSRLVDVDGNEYIDFWLGHTALILGHSPPEVVKDVRRQIENGTHFGTAHELEITLARQVAKMVPGIEMVRFTNSGTEANMYAVRLARTFTGREKIAKFEGGWHGGYDALDVGIKPPLDIPESGGLTAGTLRDTVVLPFNEIEEVRKEVERKELAAVIIEPVQGAGGCIPAGKEFLKELRDVCTETDTLLVFDEVITGFRLAPGGAQQYFGVPSDITVMGKILGGGFPVGAFAGRKEIMDYLDPLLHERPQYSFHGGTFCANPITMVAGLATLRLLEDGRLIDRLNRSGEKTRHSLSDIFGRHNTDVQVTGTSSLLQTHFTHDEVNSVRDAFRADRERLMDYHMYLIENGVFFLQGRTGALSVAHTKDDLEKLLQKAEAYAKKDDASIRINQMPIR